MVFARVRALSVLHKSGQAQGEAVQPQTFAQGQLGSNVGAPKHSGLYLPMQTSRLPHWRPTVRKPWSRVLQEAQFQTK